MSAPKSAEAQGREKLGENPEPWSLKKPVMRYLSSAALVFLRDRLGRMDKTQRRLDARTEQQA